MASNLEKDKDERIICDKCDKYTVSPCGSSESCVARYEGSRVIPYMTEWYINERMSGEKNTCKAFKKIVTHF